MIPPPEPELPEVEVGLGVGLGLAPGSGFGAAPEPGALVAHGFGSWPGRMKFTAGTTSHPRARSASQFEVGTEGILLPSNQ